MSFLFTKSYKERLECNLEFVPSKLKDKINKANVDDLEILSTQEKGNYNLRIDKKNIHSSFYPQREAERQLKPILEKANDTRIYLFIGNGLGYSIQFFLKNKNFRDVSVIWVEHCPKILKASFSIFDFSIFLESKVLKILFFPFSEDDMSLMFKGFSGYPMTFIPHKGSFLWNGEKYQKIKNYLDEFLKKKDANLTTLTKFEKLWTKNLLLNISKLIQMKPISFLFDIAENVDFLVCGAGPNLIDLVKDIKKYRDNFILITVDTALNILTKFDIEPDLIFTVDPQSINTAYLQGYKGDARIVFDPTSSYHTLRLSGKFLDGFYTSSPFPIFEIIKNYSKVSIGEVEFGGSVSTNSISLAEKMGARNIFLAGQDLCFTSGLAHCKGAILEERLNFKESRFFRRENHNYIQLHSLERRKITGIDKKTEITNDKMIIFRKWLEKKNKKSNWYNLNTKGSIIQGTENISLEKFYNKKFINKEKVSFVKKKIKSHFSKDTFYQSEFFKEIKNLLSSLDKFESLIRKAESLSLKVYDIILKQKNQSLQKYLDEAEEIDKMVLKEKKINKFLANSMQRVILMITEGYLEKLNEREKLDKNLEVAKKNIILYQGVLSSVKLQKRLLKKAYREIQLDVISLSSLSISNKAYVSK